MAVPLNFIGSSVYAGGPIRFRGTVWSMQFIVSYAQNKTPGCLPFIQAMGAYCRANSAELLIVKGSYKNPTNEHEAADQDEDWYAPCVRNYLTDERRELCRNLVLLADIRVQPTAVTPLTGFNVMVGNNSAILGHTKRALECIATSTRMPRILATTGACTVANYSNSKAGAKGVAHHVIGALVVDVCEDGTYLLRQVTWDESSQSFTDLDTVYTPRGAKKATRAKALVLGDLHVGRESWPVIKATKALMKALRPTHLVLHDVLDGTSFNPHESGMRARYAGKDASVEAEVVNVARVLTRISKWGADFVHVTRANHDEFLERFADSLKPYENPLQAPYFHNLWVRTYEYYADTGHWPNLLEMECRRLHVRGTVRFLRRNESLKIAGCELGFHGDKGLSGARGAPAHYARLGVKTVTGHTHSPKILEGAYTVGVTAKLDHGYNNLPGAWMHAHAVIYADGKRSLIFIVNGQYTGQKKAAKVPS